MLEAAAAISNFLAIGYTLGVFRVGLVFILFIVSFQRTMVVLLWESAFVHICKCIWQGHSLVISTVVI